jgi:adenylosuccinate lyase
MVTTFPKKRFNIEESKIDPNTLAAGRYGTQEMCEIFGSEKTFEYSLIVQAQAAKTLSRLYPDIVSKEDAIEIENKANLKIINPSRIRELEAKTGHDVIAINTALEEVVNDSAKTQINKGKTSADTTQPARAVQLKKALKVIIDSVENIRDITLEKSMDWIDVPHMDVTHGYDALPTVAGRPLSHYAEMLQFDLELLKYVYKNSTIGKWEMLPVIITQQLLLASMVSNFKRNTVKS